MHCRVSLCRCPSLESLRVRVAPSFAGYCTAELYDSLASVLSVCTSIEHLRVAFRSSRECLPCSVVGCVALVLTRDEPVLCRRFLRPGVPVRRTPKKQFPAVGQDHLFGRLAVRARHPAQLVEIEAAAALELRIL